MVRTLQWKYVYHELGGVQELYDVQADPQELENLAADRPQVVSEMRGALIDWAREHGDDHIFDDAGDLVVTDEGVAECDCFNAGRMGWRWY
jgi:choline-sulfatase